MDSADLPLKAVLLTDEEERVHKTMWSMALLTGGRDLGCFPWLGRVLAVMRSMPWLTLFVEDEKTYQDLYEMLATEQVLQCTDAEADIVVHITDRQSCFDVAVADLETTTLQDIVVKHYPKRWVKVYFGNERLSLRPILETFLQCLEWSIQSMRPQLSDSSCCFRVSFQIDIHTWYFKG